MGACATKPKAKEDEKVSAPAPEPAKEEVDAGGVVPETAVKEEEKTVEVPAEKVVEREIGEGDKGKEVVVGGDDDVDQKQTPTNLPHEGGEGKQPEESGEGEKEQEPKVIEIPTEAVETKPVAAVVTEKPEIPVVDATKDEETTKPVQT